MITVDIGFDPIIARLGTFELGWHGILTSVAVLAGVWLALWLAARRGISTDMVANIATWGVVGGIVGARVFHVLDHLPTYLQDPASILAVWQGGIAVYGAFIGGVVAGGFFAGGPRAGILPLLGISAPPLFLGQ